MSNETDANNALAGAAVERIAASLYLESERKRFALVLAKRADTARQYSRRSSLVARLFGR